MANHKHSKKELAALARQREARIDYQNDLQVLSIDQCAKLENTSRPTLLRQIDAGNGPRTIQLSARRVGVRRSRLSRMEGAADASVKEKADGRVQTRHRLFVLEGHARMSNPTERDIESGSAWKLSPRIARHNSPPSGAEQKMSFQTLAAANVAGPTLPPRCGGTNSAGNAVPIATRDPIPATPER